MLFLSHWKLGKELKGGSKINVSVDMAKSFEVKQCGVHIVYSNLEEENNETPTEEDKTPTEEDMIKIKPSIYSTYQTFFEGDLSAYQMSTGAFLFSNHECFLDQRRSGDEWVHNDLMEITWLTDDEEELEDEEDD
ncbi:unnamed protein product [Ilex paraguariensis]|uniref:Uncharacterized protein n=1 Tax=Ilex paraguariensis TaxID=185542 RepID=A0ABC8S107_9AQUA